MASAEALKRYRALFDSLDSEHSGVISKVAAITTLGSLDSKIFDTEGLIAMIRTQNRRQFTFEQFSEVMQEFEKNDQVDLENAMNEESSSGDSNDDGEDDVDPLELVSMDEAILYKKLFDDLDIEKKGKLSAAAIHEKIRNLHLRGVAMTQDELTFYFALVECAENSHSRFISFEEMMVIAQNHPDFVEDYARSVQASQPGLGLNLKKLPSCKSIIIAEDDEDEGDAFDDYDPDLVAKFRKVFDEFDEDGNGRMSVDEVNAAMEKLGRRPTEAETDFIFTLLQLVGTDGLNFKDFVTLMIESSESICRLGRSVSTWKHRQDNREATQTRKLVRANISRFGLKATIEKEDARIAEEETKRLERLNVALRQPSFDVKEDPEHEGGGGSGTRIDPIKALTPIELRRYQVVFNALDKNQDGSITMEEFAQTIKDVIGRQPSKQEVRDFMSLADEDSSGTLEFEEFVTIMLKTKQSLAKKRGPQGDGEHAKNAAQRMVERYRIVFDRMDKNRDGVVSIDELVDAVGQHGKHLSRKAAELVIETASDGDSELEFEAFIKLLQTQFVPHKVKKALEAVAQSLEVMMRQT